MGLLSPNALAPGDTVAVCAPCGPVDEAPFRSGLSILSRRYNVSCAPDIPGRRTAYLAGTDEQRAQELNDALADPDIRAIFCARGGYGALRILRLLDPSLLAADPKPICGFSDVTVLLHWSLRAGVIPVHGPVVTQLGRLHADDLFHLFRLLEDPSYRPVYEGRPWLEPADATQGQIEGTLWGGNLAVLASLAGTGYLNAPSTAILALEEVAEPPYRLDRMLTQLHLSGDLGTVGAVALGQVLDKTAASQATHTEQTDPQLQAVMAERFAAWRLPAIRDLPWGHGRSMRAWPMGARGWLDCKTARLRLQDGAVSGP